MTVKELKEKINNIDKKYDNIEIITDDPNYDEYYEGFFMGSSLMNIKNIFIFFRDTENQFYIKFCK